jgi:hypothetical protein
MRTALVSALVATTLMLPPVAIADSLGTAGKLVGLRDVNAASDDYALIRGSVWVDEGKGAITEYRWGGSVCPGRNLSEDEIANLSRALNDSQLRLIPIYQNGQGNSVCLTHFLLVSKRVVGDVEPFPFGQ